MAVPAVLLLVPFGLLFLLSGLVINCVQAILFVIIRPFARNLYRRINRQLSELLWLQLVWLVDWWAGVKVELYGDAEIFNSMGKEHALLVSNHRSDIDWLVGWVLAERAGCLGGALAVMKKSSKFLPVIGWSMWFAEYLFLERSWAKDERTLKVGLKRLEDFPLPLWLALFVEGTRFTPAKLLAAQEYAAANGLHIPRNVLVPRTKVHVHMKRRAMSELPPTDDEVAQWCRDLFVAKDALLDKHIAEGSFGGEVRQLGRPVKSLVVVIFWSSILSYTTFRFFRWSQLLSTWKGVCFTTIGLALVTVCMQVCIAFSQAERSSTAKAARNRVKKE
ncbi:1-acyl-sn-glycerol-3-phosphate acyltransferase PLS1-like isoform X2 [Carex rostrata]